jgi:hypothetical protein
VPGDPGDAPVRVPGVVRLLLDPVLFTAAVGLLVAAGLRGIAIGLGVLIVLHYVVSYDRVAWLLSQ